MRTPMSRLPALLLLCYALLSLPPRAFACVQIPSPNDIKHITGYDLVVAADVLEVDDAGIGAILQAHRYLKGHGGEYLAIMPYPPALQIAGRLRWYHTGCLYTGQFLENWRQDDFVYVWLKSNGDGTYSRGPFYRAQRGIVDFHFEGADASLPIAEFEQLLLERSQQPTASEPASNPYPLMRFLNITTESGERYRLNPDRTLTRLDPARDPIAISHDGTHIMFRLAETVLVFQYLAHSKKPVAPWIEPANSELRNAGRYPSEGRFAENGWLHAVKGRHGVFSPDSNLVAIQDDARIAVHLFSSVSLYGPAAGFGHRMAMEEIASFGAAWRLTDLGRNLVWSGNSKAIAFQDKRGIWIWNMLVDKEPQFVTSTAADQHLIELSASGRFLRFGNQTSWTLVDALLGETWQDTLVTPDESRLARFVFERAEDHIRQHKQRQKCAIPRSDCPIEILLSAEIGIGSRELPMDVFWHEPYQLGLAFPAGVASVSWSLSLGRLPNLKPVGLAYLPLTRVFEYDADFDQPAFAFEDSKIGLNVREMYGYDAVDLSKYLDSPIVDLDWGQPIFYMQS